MSENLQRTAVWTNAGRTAGFGSTWSLGGMRMVRAEDGDGMWCAGRDWVGQHWNPETLGSHARRDQRRDIGMLFSLLSII